MARQILPLALVSLCACQGPWGDMETLSDQTLAPGSGQVEAVAGTEGTDRVGSSEDLAARAAVAQIEASERKGFLSVLKSLIPEKSAETQAAEVALAGLVIEDDLPLESPATPDDDSARMPGLFGLFSQGAGVTPDKATAVRKGPEKDVVPGTVMAFGNIGRVCELKVEDLGEKVASYPEEAEKYTLYDPDPESTRMRSLYLTGFEDGCVRQISGAMAMFGDVEMHEVLRFGTAGSIGPETEVAKAYNKVKRQVCKVRASKPCGDRMSELQKDTVFLSVYETFGAGGRWNNVLLHGGYVEAASLNLREDQ